MPRTGLDPRTPVVVSATALLVGLACAGVGLAALGSIVSLASALALGFSLHRAGRAGVDTR